MLLCTEATHHSGQAFHYGGFSFCGAWALGVWASVAAALSCGSIVAALGLPVHIPQWLCAQALLLCGMWDLPRQVFEPMSSVSAGGFLSTVPPGKSEYWLLSSEQPKLSLETASHIYSYLQASPGSATCYWNTSLRFHFASHRVVMKLK